MSETYLFLDTETTGFPSEKISYTDPKQARAVQIAALLTDKDGSSLAEFSCILKRDNFEIPNIVAEIHGITNEVADQYGIDRVFAFNVLGELVDRSSVVLAHNFQFDNRILTIEDAHYDYGWKLAPRAICTMTAMTPICKLPKARGEGYKWPKMMEAYQHCFGKCFENAHDALADVRACKDVFFWLKERNLIND